ncbi:MAG: putative dual-specificity RNA methyltransferase RlmN [Firmicutes bacterium]|nr:putative dual-specificity RNA methyltransferase RlmN [candidate division NPL-UPA2 bacterium]MBT9155733.1 putative dual-specificity RNA methyltransferase RlmN [candidate division NPL-UPA2 bacterium]
MVLDFITLAHEERSAWIASLGEQKYRVQQIEEWIFKQGVLDYTQMANLPKSLRDTLAQQSVPVLSAKVVAARTDGGATKLAVELVDTQVVEAVIMRYRHGLTLCVSTQAGCKMGCAFCATAKGGFARNLSRHEMLAQLLLANAHLRAKGERVTHIVLMGMGEPLDNYEESLAFIRIAVGPLCSISARRISVSTCGLVPGIERLAGEGLPLTLTVSLNAADDELRQSLMPVAKAYPVNVVLAAMHRYAEVTKRRVTIEYVLIKGVNDRERHARELVQKIKGGNFHVNLIPYNPVANSSFESPLPASVRMFKEVLSSEGIAVTVRRGLGTSVQGACGQLRGNLQE